MSVSSNRWCPQLHRGNDAAHHGRRAGAEGKHAELRSATPLGDVFVALKPPFPADPGAPLLKDGDTIGLESTRAAATVESLLGSAAILVNGGSVRNFTKIVNGLGKATGDQGQAFGDLIRRTNHTLGKLNARSNQISTALTETSRSSNNSRPRTT